jgi:hypothetical protein
VDAHGYYHNVVQSARIRVGVFSWVVWALGFMLAVATLPSLGLKAFVFALIGLVIGLPIPDVGPPHKWIALEWERRAQWKRDQGRMLVNPLSEEPDSPPSKIERTEVVYATVERRSGDALVAQAFPILTDDDREFATVPIRLNGAAESYLASDPDGRFEWDLTWFESMAEALGVTKEKDLQVAFSHFHRPANMELAIDHVRKRGAPDVFSAPDGSVKGQLADNVVDRIEMVDGGSAGDARDYVFVRTPWPSRIGRSLSLEDSESFKRSTLFRTVSRTVQAYVDNDVSASFLPAPEVQQNWDYVWRVQDSDKIHMYEERDKELVSIAKRLDADSVNEQLPLDKGVSITASQPGDPGWINYNGTTFIVGLVKKPRQAVVPSGFRGHIVLSDDTYYGFTVYVEAKLRSVEETKAREKERFTKVSPDNPLERGLSDPKGGERLERIRQRRQDLASTGNRVAHYYMFVSVAAGSLTEATYRWDDLVTQMAPIYTIERFDARDDIEDALLAQWGLRFKRD